MVTTCLVVVALSEDGGGQGVEVVTALVKRLLSRVIDPLMQTQRIRFEPFDLRHKPAVTANAWLSNQPRDQQKISEFNKYLARLLKVGPPIRVIVHHVDADAPWNEREECVRLVLWRKRVYAPVTALCGDGPAQRLVPLVAHPEIEAWLYLNVGQLETLAERDSTVPPKPPAGGWHSIAAVKDEHDWPKDAYNLELARSFPAERAAAESPSLAWAVGALRAVPGLVEALTATYASSGS